MDDAEQRDGAVHERPGQEQFGEKGGEEEEIGGGECIEFRGDALGKGLQLADGGAVGAGAGKVEAGKEAGEGHGDAVKSLRDVGAGMEMAVNGDGMVAAGEACGEEMAEAKMVSGAGGEAVIEDVEGQRVHAAVRDDGEIVCRGARREGRKMMGGLGPRRGIGLLRRGGAG